MNKNTFIIDDLDMHALGIAHKNNKTIFIDNALIGEEIEAEQIKEKNNLVFAKNVNIITKSKDRTIPPCPYFLTCGGCSLQHLNYEKSLLFKENQLKITIKKILNLNFEKIEIVRSSNPYYYRNKIAMNISEIDNNLSLCYYKKSSQTPIKIDSCKIAKKEFDIVINEFNNFLTCNLNEKTNLKHLVARIINNNLLLTIVVKNKVKLENLNTLYNNLKQHFLNVGINLNINKKDNEILSNNFINLLGKNEIDYSLFNINTKITNASFLQVNEDVQNKLYSFVTNNVSGTVVNAYSGAGLLTCLLAKSQPKNSVYGVEINSNANNLANKLKENNNLTNIENYCGDAGEILNKLNLNNYTLVIDPPRKGIDDNMINLILNSLPNKIIYISCNPNSLCKNLKPLLSFYKIETIKGFDMFPQTTNLESVVILTKI